MQAWWGRVFEYSASLPRSLSDLVSAISEQNGGRLAWMSPGHPVKARGFVQWMRRTHGVDLTEQVRRHLTDRTDPYDVSIMLDDPGL
jgi:hypothetical protein